MFQNIRLFLQSILKAVFSLDSAFYYHGLTDVIPDKYYLTTEKSAAKIKDPRVVQIFRKQRCAACWSEKYSIWGH